MMMMCLCVRVSLELGISETPKQLCALATGAQTVTCIVSKPIAIDLYSVYSPSVLFVFWNNVSNRGNSDAFHACQSVVSVATHHVSRRANAAEPDECARL